MVAKNVLKHPLTPTLVDDPYLPYSGTSWNDGHVWLHKPILPFWQAALSLALFGVNTFALRLPAAVLSTAAAFLTYLIGKDLFDRRTALVAATLQALNPFLMLVIHGYQFADNIDIALLFWVEIGVYFLTRAARTGAWPDVLLAGWAQGLAFLCKSYLAGILFGLALTIWLLPYCRLAKREDCRLGPLRLLAMLAVTIGNGTKEAVAGVYCMASVPGAITRTEAHRPAVFSAIRAVTNVEGWGAPWDRVAFDYLIRIYGVFYGPILTAGLVFIGKAVPGRHRGLWITYAWGLGVVVPHLFAETKTPSATLIALPAALLLLGHLIAEASRGHSGDAADAALDGVGHDPGHASGQQ